MTIYAFLQALCVYRSTEAVIIPETDRVGAARVACGAGMNTEAQTGAFSPSARVRHVGVGGNLFRSRLQSQSQNSSQLSLLIASATELLPEKALAMLPSILRAGEVSNAVSVPAFETTREVRGCDAS